MSVRGTSLVRRFGEVAVRGVHFAGLARRTGVESITRPEEVSMHPMMIMAVAREVERERQRDRHKVQLRSPALATRAQSFDVSHAASGFARRLLAGIACGPDFPSRWPATRYRGSEDSR
jgi:hypothetical protein